MKRRESFVTNSSSTSYIVVGKSSTKERLLELDWKNCLIIYTGDYRGGYILDSKNDLEELLERNKTTLEDIKGDCAFLEDAAYDTGDESASGCNASKLFKNLDIKNMDLNDIEIWTWCTTDR
jgi:hypothetical protein